MALYMYQGWTRRKAVYTTYYLQPDERRDLIKDCGVSGLVLFEYYLYLNKKTIPEVITDERAAEWFGWTLATAKRHRLSLIKKGWFYIQKFYNKDKQKIEVYHLGQDGVAAAMQPT